MLETKRGGGGVLSNIGTTPVVATWPRGDKYQSRSVSPRCPGRRQVGVWQRARPRGAGFAPSAPPGPRNGLLLAQSSFTCYIGFADRSIQASDTAVARECDPDSVLMLGQRRRRWPSIGTESGQCQVDSG